jgi:hypothetical protein
MSVALADAYELVKERRAYFPDEYKGASPFVGTAAQSIQPESYFSSGRFDAAPLMEFRWEQKTYVTPKPILVKVYREDDIFFAENESLVLCGAGASREEAILDFVKHLDYFYNFYKRQNESNLMGDALRLKKIYDNLLVETQCR